MTFVVCREAVRLLEKRNWKLYYELFTISVLKDCLGFQDCLERGASIAKSVPGNKLESRQPTTTLLVSS